MTLKRITCFNMVGDDSGKLVYMDVWIGRALPLSNHRRMGDIDYRFEVGEPITIRGDATDKIWWIQEFFRSTRIENAHVLLSSDRKGSAQATWRASVPEALLPLPSMLRIAVEMTD